MRIIAIAILILLVQLDAAAQRAGFAPIKGIVLDSATSQPLEAATVSVYIMADSSLVSYAITNKRGEFTIQNVPKEKPCRVVVTFRGLQQYEKDFTIPLQSKELIISTIGLPRQVTTLDEVVVSRLRPPVTIKRDTIEFNAGSFKGPINGVVEDLLRQLPGVEIDLYGNITVNGQPVAKITVDGNDFFGKDIKLTTKNLPKDIIDKIQVVDSKSNEQKFSNSPSTGKEKVLNLVLKKDKKQGLFGRASVGVGTAERYEISTNLNHFDPKKQISFIGYDNNTNNNGGATAPLSSLNQSNTPARLRKQGIGANLGWSVTPKLKFNGSLFYNSDYQRSQSQVDRSNFLPDTAYNYASESDALARNNGIRLSIQADYKPDSLTEISMSSQIQQNVTHQQNYSVGENFTINGIPINQSENHFTSVSKAPSISAYIFAGRRFKKKGRIFTLNLSVNYNTTSGDDYTINNLSSVIVPGNPTHSFRNQHIDVSGSVPYLSLSATWTEPLLPKLGLRIAYSQNTSRNRNSRLAYSIDTLTGLYTMPDSSFSSNFTSLSGSQSPSVSLQYLGTRTTVEFGAGLQRNTLSNNENGNLGSIEQKVSNFQPSAHFTHRLSETGTFRFYYNGNSQQPSLLQLQPVPDATNPQYVRHGNPALRPSFMHNLGMEIQKNRGTSYINGLLAYSISTNLIVEETWLDSVQHFRPINSNGNYTFSANLNYSTSWRTGQSTYRITIGSGASQNAIVSYSNKIENRSKILGVTPRLSMQYSYKDKFILQPNISGTYSTTRYSITTSNRITNKAINISFFSQIQFGHRLIMENTLQYNYNQRAGLRGLNVAVWNSSINYYIAANRKWILRLAGFDLLNKNSLIQNTITPIYSETTRSEVIQRYLLVGLTWNIRQF